MCEVVTIFSRVWVREICKLQEEKNRRSEGK